MCYLHAWVPARGRANQVSALPSIFKNGNQNWKEEGNIPSINKKITIFLKNILFYLEYFGAISKSNFKQLQCKFVIIRVCSSPNEGRKEHRSFMGPIFFHCYLPFCWITWGFSLGTPS